MLASNHPGIIIPGRTGLTNLQDRESSDSIQGQVAAFSGSIQGQVTASSDSIKENVTAPPDSLRGQVAAPPDSIRGQVAAPSDSIRGQVAAPPDSVREQIPAVAVEPGAPSGEETGAADSVIHRGESASDTLQTVVPVPLPVAGQQSVWERIDNREREIRETRSEKEVETRVTATITSIADPEPGPVDFKYDASYYLDPDSEIPFFREYIFPVSGRQDQNVFAGGDNSITHNSAVAYRTYLENEVSAGNDDLHYSISWIPGVVILSILLLTWIKLAYLQFLTPVLVSAFNYKKASKLYQSKHVPSHTAFFILHLVFAVNTGLFVLFIFGHFNLNIPDIGPLLLFLIISLSVVFLIAFKNAALRLTGYLFDTSKLLREYSHNVSLYNKIFGIALMPVIVGLLYADQSVHGTLIYTGLILGAVFYLLQLIRGLEIIVRKEFSVFYSILYLCAFEILPVVIIYKLFDTFLI